HLRMICSHALSSKLPSLGLPPALTGKGREAVRIWYSAMFDETCINNIFPITGSDQLWNTKWSSRPWNRTHLKKIKGEYNLSFKVPETKGGAPLFLVLMKDRSMKPPFTPSCACVLDTTPIQ
ncbi:MAG: hypothetical protein P8X96_18365, partial [Desulfobacteraceae bacterium]